MNPNDRSSNSTEHPPAASGADLVEGATPAAGPLLPPPPAVGGTVTTQDPPHGHGAVVLGADLAQPGPAAVTPDEVPAESESQERGLHAADVAPLIEPQVG